jgi:hypothetical protein
MSDDEEVMHSEEEAQEEPEAAEQSEEEEEESRSAPEPSGPSEAELAMQRRRAATKIDSSALDEEAQELLAENAELRAKMEDEIQELRLRSEERKKEREEEERQLGIRRQEEEARRKKEEEERNNKKNAEENAKRAARAEKMAEFEKWKNVAKPNFVISKKESAAPVEGDEDDEEQIEKKSKEQIEAEKRAILAQRTPKLEISGFDSGKLTDKAKELHKLILRLESEKYDLEKRFKAQQYDMMELAERARSMNKVGKGAETLKRVQMTDEADKMSERFAGCPSKIVMYSQFERQKDPRNWNSRQTVFTGPHVLYAAAKIPPARIVKFNPENGLPEYEDIPGAVRQDEDEEE